MRVEKLKTNLKSIIFSSLEYFNKPYVQCPIRIDKFNKYSIIKCIVITINLDRWLLKVTSNIDLL